MVIMRAIYYYMYCILYVVYNCIGSQCSHNSTRLRLNWCGNRLQLEVCYYPSPSLASARLPCVPAYMYVPILRPLPLPPRFEPCNGTTSPRITSPNPSQRVESPRPTSLSPNLHYYNSLRKYQSDTLLLSAEKTESDGVNGVKGKTAAMHIHTNIQNGGRVNGVNGKTRVSHTTSINRSHYCSAPLPLLFSGLGNRVTGQWALQQTYLPSQLLPASPVQPSPLSHLSYHLFPRPPVLCASHSLQHAAQPHLQLPQLTPFLQHSSKGELSA